MTEEIENIPQSNQLLFNLKLVTGEEIICTLVDADTNKGGLVIESPIIVAVLPVMVEGGGINNTLSSRLWMPFAVDRTFFLEWRSIVLMTPLAPSYHVMYTQMVNRLEDQLKGVEDLADDDKPSISSFEVAPDYNIH